MADFTARDIKAFDLLTVIVMLEQCEPDLTMVQYMIPYQDRATGARCASPTTTCCLPCLYRRTSLGRSDARSDIISQVKRGAMQILDIHPRSELAPCKTCPPLQRF